MASFIFNSLGFWVVVNLTHVVAHLLTARIVGVTLNRISFGIGPTLWQRTTDRGTTLRLALFPVGFIVRLRAPDVEPENAPERDLSRRSFWVQLAVFASAPLGILLLAFAGAVWANSFERGVETTVLEEVVPQMAAARAGILVGDEIVSIAGQTTDSAAAMRQVLDALPSAQDVKVEVRRGTDVLTFPVTLELAPSDNRRVLGVRLMQRMQAAPPWGRRLAVSFEALGQELHLTAQKARALLLGTSVKTVGGPVVFYVTDLKSGRAAPVLTANMAMAAGLKYFLQCLYMPYLDGVRMLFLVIGALRPKAVSRRVEARFNKALVCLIVLLALLMAKNEFARLLS